MNRPSDDPIEVYLDQLLTELPGTPRHVRHTLSEVEAHLPRQRHWQRKPRDSTNMLPRFVAVQRMGPIDGVIDSRASRFRLTPARRRRAVLGALFVGAAGGLAVGAAGLVAAVVRMIAGDAAVGIPFPTGAYSQSDCTRWLAAYPNARDCVAAMTIDHANDFLLSTGAVGVVGVVCLSLFVWLRHRWNSHAVAAVAPAYVEDVAAGTVRTTGGDVSIGARHRRGPRHPRPGCRAVVLSRGCGIRCGCGLHGSRLVAGATASLHVPANCPVGAEHAGYDDPAGDGRERLSELIERLVRPEPAVGLEDVEPR